MNQNNSEREKSQKSAQRIIQGTSRIITSVVTSMSLYFLPGVPANIRLSTAVDSRLPITTELAQTQEFRFTHARTLQILDSPQLIMGNTNGIYGGASVIPHDKDSETLDLLMAPHTLDDLDIVMVDHNFRSTPLFSVKQNINEYLDKNRKSQAFLEAVKNDTPIRIPLTAAQSAKIKAANIIPMNWSVSNLNKVLAYTRQTDLEIYAGVYNSYTGEITTLTFQLDKNKNIEKNSTQPYNNIHTLFLEVTGKTDKEGNDMSTNIKNGICIGNSGSPIIIFTKPSIGQLEVLVDKTGNPISIGIVSTVGGDQLTPTFPIRPDMSSQRRPENVFCYPYVGMRF